MADLAAERFAVAATRHAYEAALRELRTAEVRADYHREPDGSFPVVDQTLNHELCAELAARQAGLDAATAALDATRPAVDQAVATYDAAARQAPLFDADNADPVLLLPVRIEAVYVDLVGASELRIRVYPDDVHVDDHEPALTEGERSAGIAYWRAVRAAGADGAKRAAAWQAIRLSRSLSSCSRVGTRSLLTR